MPLLYWELWVLCREPRIQKGAKVHVLYSHGAISNKHRSQNISNKHRSQNMSAKLDVSHGKWCPGETPKCSKIWPGQRGQERLSRSSGARSVIWKMWWMERRPVWLEHRDQGEEVMQASWDITRSFVLMRRTWSHWFLRGWSYYHSTSQWPWNTLFTSYYP